MECKLGSTVRNNRAARWLTIMVILCVLSFSSLFFSADWRAVIGDSSVIGMWQLLAGKNDLSECLSDADYDLSANNDSDKDINYHQCTSHCDFLRWKRSIRKRVNSVQKQCDALGANANTTDLFTNHRLLKRLIVDTKHEVIYCDIPKIATTNWRRVFLWFLGVAPRPEQIAYDDVYQVYEHSLRKLVEFSANDTLKMLQSYQKLLFVRHPFERLASAFRDKFIERRGYFDLRFGQKLRKFRPNFTIDSAPHVLNDTYNFDEFVRYVLSVDPHEANEHWASYVELCQPCQVNYTLIGQLEHQDSDIPCTLRVLLAEEELSTFSFPSSIRKTAKSVLAADYFKLLTPNETKSLWKHFEADFQLFGYEFPNDWFS